MAQPLHEEAVRGCSFLYIIAKKSVTMSEAFLVDVSIHCNRCYWDNHIGEVYRQICGGKLRDFCLYIR